MAQSTLFNVDQYRGFTAVLVDPETGDWAPAADPVFARAYPQAVIFRWRAVGCPGIGGARYIEDGC